MKTKWKRALVALVPLSVLVVLLAVDISLFGADSILGPSQVALLAAAGLAAALGMLLYKIPWSQFEKAMEGNVGGITGALVILLLIGAISGSWTVSGVVPTFICYGLKIISPRIFLLTACLLCALVSLMTGSSWTTIATVGVALIGIGRAEGFPDAMTAGAIISGAYFGDKISPLSDTTVLASSVNGVPLFRHIHYMYYTTVPSFLLTLAIFTVLGFTQGGGDTDAVQLYGDTLRETFRITPWLLVVPAFTVFLIWKKLPAIVVLALSCLAAIAAALVFQPGLVRTIGEAVTGGGSAFRMYFSGVAETLYNSLSLETGVPEVNRLVATRGMLGMLNTVFLIICAMCFGAAMQASGMIRDLAALLEPFTRTRTGLVGCTALTGTALNGIVSDQYLAILLTSNLYKERYEKDGCESRLLSRSVEDSATVTSPLFPWSSCGMTQATILGVATLAYAPFCFFCLLSPLVTTLAAAFTSPSR